MLNISIPFFIRYYNKIIIYFFHQTPLTLAIEEEKIESVKCLLSNEKVDINYPKIFIQFF